MRWFLYHIPQWGMNIMLKLMTALPAGMRKPLMAFMMGQMLEMNDADLVSVVEKLTHSIFTLNPAQSERFAITRLACVTEFPKDAAARIVRPMGKACKEGPFKAYVREQAMIQRLILAMPKEKQMQIAEIFEAADNTGFLPLEVAQERRGLQENKPMVCHVCNVPLALSAATSISSADCPNCGTKGSLK